MIKLTPTYFETCKLPYFAALHLVAEKNWKSTFSTKVKNHSNDYFVNNTELVTGVSFMHSTYDHLIAMLPYRLNNTK